MKFQNRSIHGSKVNRRTDRQTDRQAESNMPFQLFQSWGHKNGGIRGVNIIQTMGTLPIKPSCSVQKLE